MRFGLSDFSIHRVQGCHVPKACRGLWPFSCYPLDFPLPRVDLHAQEHKDAQLHLGYLRKKHLENAIDKQIQIAVEQEAAWICSGNFTYTYAVEKKDTCGFIVICSICKIDLKHWFKKNNNL